MKKRISRVLNFLAFNLLFFALYLNFIHKDNNNLPEVTPRKASTTAVQGTVLVSNPEQYLNKQNVKQPAQSTVQLQTENGGDKKPSFN